MTRVLIEFERTEDGRYVTPDQKCQVVPPPIKREVQQYGLGQQGFKAATICAETSARLDHPEQWVAPAGLSTPSAAHF